MNGKISKCVISVGIISLITTVTTAALSHTVVKAAVGSVTRISGSDRYATAAQVAVRNWTSSSTVILVSGDGYADAVSASTLAKRLDAPILLTNSEKLNPDTSSALTLLKAKSIYVIGGNASISQNIRDELKQKYRLIELSGNNRYETNLAVAKELMSYGVDRDNLMMVGGDGFSDALSVAPVASAKNQILLLANNDMDCMKPTIEFIKSYDSKVTIVGTESVIDDKIYNAVNGTLRINGGEDRFQTNLKVLSSFNSALNFNKVYAANASNNGYADALVASVVAGKTGAALVLLDSEKSKATTNAIDYIKTNITKNSDLNVIGGRGVVTDNTVDAINLCVKDNSIVTFKDDNLEKAVRNCINKPKGTLYKNDVNKISELKASDCRIQDISGIENLTSLQKLDLSANILGNINELKNLTDLSELNLSGCGAEDISSLENLTNLKQLDLSSSCMKDLSALKNLINLEKLNLSYNYEMENLNGLKDLTNLKELNLKNSKVKDLTPLKNLTSLKELNLSDDRVRDINPLKNLINLQKLQLQNSRPYEEPDGNKISDLEPLKGLINLQYLNLNEIGVINNIDPLKNLTSLKELNLNNNAIKDINPLGNLTNLQTLDLYGNQISDISSLKNLVKLNHINLSNNKISDEDIEALKKYLPNCK